MVLRPELVRGNEVAPAGSERPRKSDATVGRIAVERDVRLPPAEIFRLFSARIRSMGSLRLPMHWSDRRRSARWLGRAIRRNWLAV